MCVCVYVVCVVGYIACGHVCVVYMVCVYRVCIWCVLHGFCSEWMCMYNLHGICVGIVCTWYVLCRFIVCGYVSYSSYNVHVSVTQLLWCVGVYGVGSWAVGQSIGTYIGYGCSPWEVDFWN